jgi:hypothetical protein
MEMQTGSTKNHISQIFFVFAAPISWWNRLAAPVLMPNNILVPCSGNCQYLKNHLILAFYMIFFLKGF